MQCLSLRILNYLQGLLCTLSLKITFFDKNTLNIYNSLLDEKEELPYFLYLIQIFGLYVHTIYIEPREGYCNDICSHVAGSID